MGILSSLFGKSTKNIQPICNVDLERYAGTWYEIVRLPHSFEEGLHYVTATYNLRSDGKIEVINAGIKDRVTKVAKAVAWVPDKNCTGKLLVSFFWPFRSEYKIILLDEKEYKYAVVTSSTMNYLWILSRETKISNELFDELMEFISSKGFDVSKIINVAQNI